MLPDPGEDGSGPDPSGPDGSRPEGRGDDDGYFPRGRSVLRRIQGERAVGLLYGQRALMIGALNPVNYVGTMQSTGARGRPFRRLAHTGKVFETIFFGTREEADRELAAVARLHDRVRGALPDHAGPFPAGTPYSAYDPPLMLWTVAVMANSAEVFYELLVQRLSGRERESLWQDYVRFGELFGMPRSEAPASHAEFRAYWEERLASDELHLTEEARYVGRAIAFEIPVPRSRWPAMRLHNLLMAGSLPERVRKLYGVGWTPAHEAAFRAAARAIRTARPIVPGPLARGANTASFDLVANTEAGRIARGEPTPGALTDPRASQLA